jgi:hypothetical protein
MAICGACDQEMLDQSSVSCVTDKIKFPDGTELDPIPYNPDYGGDDHRCHDCNIKKGGIHHPGCDMERCPKCGGQMLGCGCTQEPVEQCAHGNDLGDCTACDVASDFAYDAAREDRY